MKPEEDKVMAYNNIKDFDKAHRKLKAYISVNTKITKWESDWLIKFRCWYWLYHARYTRISLLRWI